MYTLTNNGVVLATQSTPIEYVANQYAWQLDGALVCDTLKTMTVTFIDPSRKITKLAFRNRFTAAEKVTMEIASLDNPAATMAQRQQAAALRVNLADTAAAVFIDLSRADTRAGVQMLEAAGLLAAGRALQILDAPVQPSEQPL